MTIVTRPWTRLGSSCARLLWLLLLMAAAVPAPAQETTWYKIEMILFTELDSSGGEAEFWPDDPGQPPVLDAVPLSLGGPRVQALDPTAYRLSGIWSALKRSRDYRPVRHLAWQQPGLPARSAPLVAIGEGPEAPIQGTAKVSVSRFLHLNLDLLLRQGGRSYRMTASRRMRSSELHYLDHPLFGALVLITPLTE